MNASDMDLIPESETRGITPLLRAVFCVTFFGDVLHNHSFFPLQMDLKRMKWRLVKPFSCTHLSCKPVLIGSPAH